MQRKKKKNFSIIANEGPAPKQGEGGASILKWIVGYALLEGLLGDRTPAPSLGSATPPVPPEPRWFLSAAGGVGPWELQTDMMDVPAGTLNNVVVFTGRIFAYFPGGSAEEMEIWEATGYLPVVYDINSMAGTSNGVTWEWTRMETAL